MPASYNYEKVVQTYKELSAEKGRLLQHKDIINCDKLPSTAWFSKNGGMSRVHEKLGFTSDALEFCKDCVYDPFSCDYRPVECPLREDVDLYYLEEEPVHNPR